MRRGSASLEIIFPGKKVIRRGSKSSEKGSFQLQDSICGTQLLPGEIDLQSGRGLREDLESSGYDSCSVSQRAKWAGKLNIMNKVA